MRKHPLLAFFTATTTFTLSTMAVLAPSALASKTLHHRRSRQGASAHLDLAELALAHRHLAGLAPAGTRPSATLDASFTVDGRSVLARYLAPGFPRREPLARRRELSLERRREHLAARRRETEARRRVYVPAGGIWARLRACESGGNYREDTGNGYYGAYQFLPSTWWSIGFTGMPDQAPPAVQDRAARVLEARQGWGAWPECSQLLGF